MTLNTHFFYSNFFICLYRRGWDCYLAPETAPGASRIPDTWVLPPEPSNPAWARFLES